MQAEDYSKLALSTERKFEIGLTLTIQQTRLLHAAMGLVTEAGEFMDALKKQVAYGKPIDPANILEEIGDAFWYLAVALDALGFSISQAWAINADKLALRYRGEPFNAAHALTRNLAGERAILEAGVEKPA